MAGRAVGGDASAHLRAGPGRCEGEPWSEAHGACDGAAGDARKDLFSYGVVGAYAQAFRRAGFTDEIDALEAAHSKGDRDGAVAAISDRMVDAIDICGDAATVAAAVDAYRAAGVDHPVVMPLPWGPDRRQTVIDTLAAVAGH